ACGEENPREKGREEADCECDSEEGGEKEADQEVALTGRVSRSQHAGGAHDRLALLADLPRDLERITVDELAAEELDGQRPRVALLGELAQDPHDRRDAVARNQAPGVVDQLARPVLQILEVHVRELAVLDEIEILELPEPGPEMEEVEHRPDVRMRGLAG